MDLAYDSAEEDAIRKAIFAQTDAMIQEHNSDPESTYQMAHSKFSAMVNNELGNHQLIFIKILNKIFYI